MSHLPVNISNKKHSKAVSHLVFVVLVNKFKSLSNLNIYHLYNLDYVL